MKFNPFFSATTLLALSLSVLSGCTHLDPYHLLSRGEPSPIRSRDEPLPNFTTESVRATRQQTAEYVWATVRDRYHRADLNGIDWNAAKARWMPKIIDAPNENDYWTNLDRMVAELKDSHTRVESPAQVEARRLQRVLTVGLNLREVGGVLTALTVHQESDAYFAGLRPGMVITQLNARPALPTWNEWIKTSRESSSPQATRRGALRQLNDIARDQPHGVDLEFELFDGTRVATRLKRRDISTRPSVSARILPSGLGYVRFTAFSELLRGELFSALDSVKTTPGLIIDLRGNGGGSAALANALVGYFLQQKTAIGRATTRHNEPVTLAFGAVKVIALERSVPGRADAYTGKLAILLDNDSASASELVASVLKAASRATIVGETSCGCLLAFLGHASLNGGGALAYSEIGFFDINGLAVEKIGVTPSISIERSRDDLRNGRDRALEAAVASLTSLSP